MCKKAFTFWLVCIFLFTFAAVSSAQYSGGSGTEQDPYIIATAQDLIALGADANNYSSHFVMAADIDFSGRTFSDALIAPYIYNRFSGQFQGTPFMGTFNGNGHKITSLRIYTKVPSQVQKICLGLFGCIEASGQVINLNMNNVGVSGDYSGFFGGLAGINYGTIINCHIVGASAIQARYDSETIGGMVGRNVGTIKNSHATSDIIGGRGDDSYVPGGLGGLVGRNIGTITYCYATGRVSAGSKSKGLGGLVGDNRGGTITNCYAIGNVIGLDGSYGLGGLAGYNDGFITNCYAMGDVTGGNVSTWSWPNGLVVAYELGGLVGDNSGTVTDCYSTGLVAASIHSNRLGGLVGMGINVINSYWDIQTSGHSRSGGGCGKTSAELKDPNTFIGWNCSGEMAWTIDSGSDYPRLIWENKPGVPIPPQKLSDFLAGSGTADEPYQISSADQLDKVGRFPSEWDKHFVLMSDIDLSGYAGNSFHIIGIPENVKFTGVFDGNDYAIKNFIYEAGSISRVGIFGYTAGLVKNLGIRNVIIDCGYYSGCIGGLAGYNDGVITDCYTSGSVSGSIESVSLGGLVGFNQADIANCYSTASVSSGDNSYYIGGLVGNNMSVIGNCYATGKVNGGENSERLGGLVGLDHYGYIASCYATGKVTGGKNSERLGGLVGGCPGFMCPGSLLTPSFWDVETSGQWESAEGIRKTTVEMKTRSTFIDAGWDFVGETANGIDDIWCMPVDSYPQLWWEDTCP
jgi:hypothetical protein